MPRVATVVAARFMLLPYTKECAIILSQLDGRGIEMSLEDIEALLAGLQTPMTPNRLFADYLQEAWKLFQLPDEPGLPQFEAFLINAVLNEFKEADCDEDEAKNRDACLVGLGLLEGCYHTEIRDGVPTHRKLSERFISYLSGDYVKLQYPNAQADKNLNIADRKSAPRRAVERSEKRNLKRLARKLFSMKSGTNGSYQECLQAGIKNHIIEVLDEKGERKIGKIILPQPCYTIENFRPQDEKNPTTTPETAFVIAEPVESDSEPSAEQIQEPAPEPPSESPMEPAQESAPKPLSESTQEQPVDAPPEPTPVSPPEPTADPTEELNQGLLPEPAQEPPESNVEKNKPNHPSKPNKRIAIVAVVISLFAAFVVFAVLLSMIHAKDEDRNTAIDPVKAVEGGGIINPNEASVEAHTSVTIQSSSGVTIGVDIKGIEIDNIASVSVITIGDDGSPKRFTFELNETYGEIVAGQQGVTTEDFSGGVDAYEDGN